MSYEAIVTRIKVSPHPNADRLQLGSCHGHQVVVGLDTKDDELGVFFPTDGQLSEEFCLDNSLFTEPALIKLEIKYGEGQTFGFIDANRRVRAKNFRGQKSDGMWVPMNYFDNYTVGSLPLTEGFTFSSLDGKEVCNKYVSKKTREASAAKLGKKQRENKCFPKHDVTKQFRFVSRDTPADAVIYITEKLHGTSGRYGHVLDDLELPTWKRVVNWLRPETFKTREYRYLNGSKNVILEKSQGPGWYGTNEFRYKAIEGLELHKGEVLYFEIVGYVGLKCEFCGVYADEHDKVQWEHKHFFQGKPVPIMEGHNLKDDVKSLKKHYPEFMVYDYGLEAPASDIYVYKIVRMNEDGVGIDLSWPAVKARCTELGLKHVPDLCPPIVMDEMQQIHSEGLEKTVESLTDGASTLDAEHIREGVVLRIESTRGIEYVKNKSWYFGVLEGYLKDSEDYADEEESS